MVHISIKVASVPAGDKLRFPADIEYLSVPFCEDDVIDQKMREKVCHEFLGTWARENAKTVAWWKIV